MCLFKTAEPPLRRVIQIEERSIPNRHTTLLAKYMHYTFAPSNGRQRRFFATSPLKTVPIHFLKGATKSVDDHKVFLQFIMNLARCIEHIGRSRSYRFMCDIFRKQIIAAVLRRAAKQNDKPQVITYKMLTLDLDGYKVDADGRSIDLTPPRV